MSQALPCALCAKPLENALDHASVINQPSDGVSFQSHGNYGSTVWDPVVSGHEIEINVCDDCLRVLSAAGAVAHVTTTHRPSIVDYKPFVAYPTADDIGAPTCPRCGAGPFPCRPECAQGVCTPM